MRAIRRLRRDDRRDFNDAIQHRNLVSARRLRRVRPRVFEAYDRYQQHKRNLTGLAAIRCTRLQKKDLSGNYKLTGENKPLAYIREDLLDREPAEYCPYCSFGEAESLDHFLPQSLFPEFSLLSKNLVPCCPRCNLLKRAKNGEHAIHPYYDHLGTRIVYAEVEVSDAVAVRYKLRNRNGMNTKLFERCQEQFNLLELEKRWRKQASLTLANQRGALRSALQSSGVSGLKSRLREQARSHRENGGLNGFGYSLYAALANSTEFHRQAARVLARH